MSRVARVNKAEQSGDLFLLPILKSSAKCDNYCKEEYLTMIDEAHNYIINNEIRQKAPKPTSPSSSRISSTIRNPSQSSGLESTQLVGKRESFSKYLDFLKHLWLSLKDIPKEVKKR